ncbi:MAG: DUF6596 domain-containing protein [Verrucomicrobiota bacterium]
MLSANDELERVARESYGRLVAYLSRDTHDLGAAEDLLCDAITKALTKWPEQGIPDRPEAWLLRVARNRLIDQQRQRERHRRAIQQLEIAMEAFAPEALADRAPIDHRLSLMFACSHPEIDSDLRTALILNVILGVPAEQLGSAFLVKPATMSQRLVRAKKRIRDLQLSLDLPESEEQSARLHSVLDAVYGAYALGWEYLPSRSENSQSLDREALWLSELLANEFAEIGEAQALHALLLYNESRRSCRTDDAGAFVPLDRQNPEEWDAVLIDRADQRLRAASENMTFGRYQLEAAIQSAQIEGLRDGRVDHDVILLLYEGLLQHHPSVGALVAYAAAAHAGGDLDLAEQLLGRVDAATVSRYHCFWVVLAHINRDRGNQEQFHQAKQRALSLTTDARMREFLDRELSFGN